MGRFPVIILLILSVILCSAQTVNVTNGPSELQLFTRDTKNECTVPLEGTISGGSPDSVVLSILKNDSPYKMESKGVSVTGFSFSPLIDADTVNYKFNIFTKSGNVLTQPVSIDRIVCGDAFIIYGQSNAEAQHGAEEYTYRSEWIRAYRGSWVLGQPRTPAKIGVWGMQLARKIIDKHGVPIQITNAAVGGQTIEVLSRDDNNPTDVNTHYGQLLTWT